MTPCLHSNKGLKLSLKTISGIRWFWTNRLLNKKNHQLWDALNISFDDYFRTITDNDSFWAKLRGCSWDSVFMKWGYPVGTVTVMRHSTWDGKKMMWANFFKGTKKASMKETLNGPTGIHPARNGKLPTPMDPSSGPLTPQLRQLGLNYNRMIR